MALQGISKHLLTSVLLLLSLAVQSQTAVQPQGNGWISDPYLISNWQELFWISQNYDEWDKAYKQTAHIDFADANPAIETWDDSTGWTPIGRSGKRFSNRYDGNGFTISNLYINRPDAEDQGLFGYTDDDADIKNLGVIDATVNGNFDVGILAGSLNGFISKCFVTGQVEAKSSAGGFVGYNSGKISDCFANVYISNAQEKEYSRLGAFSGSIYSGATSNCYSKSSYSGIYVHGFSSYRSGSVKNSFWDSERFGSAYSDTGTATNTAEMQLQATYTGWDFTNTWSINPNVNGGYPVLKQFESLDYFAKTECYISDISAQEDGFNITGNILIGDNPIKKYGLLIGTEKVNGVVTGNDVKNYEFGSATSSGSFTHSALGLEPVSGYYMQLYSENNTGIEYSPIYRVWTILKLTQPTGSGDSEADPYLIESLSHLYWIAENVNKNEQTFEGKYFLQTQDIDAQITHILYDEKGWTPIGTDSVLFNGTYNGGGKQISNLFMNEGTPINFRYYTQHVNGLFAIIDSNAVVSNLSIVDAEVIEGSNSAILAYKNLGKIEKVHCSGKSSLNFWSNVGGGIVFENGGSISESFINIEISWREQVDAVEALPFVNRNSGSINDCYAISPSCEYQVSGIRIARSELDHSSIMNCYTIDFNETDHYLQEGLMYHSDSSSESLLSIEYFKSINNFLNAGFDFVGETKNGNEDLWVINPKYNNGFPFLKWQAPQMTYLGGSVYYDRDKDGTQSLGDVTIGGINVELLPEGTITGTLSDGTYHFYSEPGDYTVKVHLQEPYSQGQSALEQPVTLELLKDSVLNPIGLYGTDVYDFSLSTATVWSRCGRTVPVWMVVENSGNMPSDLELRLTPSNKVTYKGAEPAASSIAPSGELRFDLANVQPSEKRTVTVQFQLPAASMDTLHYTASLYRNGALVEESTLRSQIRCGYDPNDVQVFPNGHSEHGYVPMEQELTYMIRFQNTGNDTAFMVDVLDTLAPTLDPMSFTFLSASHEVRYYVERNGALRFLFEDINLEDSTSNEPASHGFVLFKVKPLSGTVAGTIAENRAHIFFDYNPAVVTNTVRTTFTDLFTPMTQNVELTEGWNLVSLYVQPSDNDLKWALGGNIEDVVAIKTGTDFYSAGQPPYLNSLQTIAGGQAYLIKAKRETVLPVYGLLMPALENPALAKGWNMVGYPLRTQTEVSSKLGTSPVQAVKDFGGFWKPDEQIPSLINFEKGKGYFIYSNSESTIEW